MSREIKLTVGNPASNLQGFVDAWHRSAAGDLSLKRVLALESKDTLVSALAADRYRLLRLICNAPPRSIEALAAQLDRQYRDVQEDIFFLEQVGLLDLTDGSIRATIDKLYVEMER